MREQRQLAKNPLSDQLYHSKVYSKLFDLFYELLPAGADEISSSTTLRLEKIKPETLTIVQPLLQEVSDFNENLDVEEFIGSCLNLLKTLSVAEKDSLLNWKFQPKENPALQHSFRPEINRVSEAILSEDQFYSLPVQERLLIREEARRAKIRKKQDAALEEERGACTFEPQLSAPGDSSLRGFTTKKQHLINKDLSVV